jgi:hypothetical protein
LTEFAEYRPNPWRPWLAGISGDLLQLIEDIVNETVGPSGRFRRPNTGSRPARCSRTIHYPVGVCLGIPESITGIHVFATALGQGINPAISGIIRSPESGGPTLRATGIGNPASLGESFADDASDSRDGFRLNGNLDVGEGCGELVDAGVERPGHLRVHVVLRVGTTVPTADSGHLVGKSLQPVLDCLEALGLKVDGDGPGLNEFP